MHLQTGTRLGPYEILAPIGAGGMGEVYRAKDTRLDRIVAIKVLPSHLSSNSDHRQRFEREARAVSSLNHPHICTLYDIGHQDGVDYIVMEMIEGETLIARLQKGPLSQADLLRYSTEIADALDKAHKHGIVHRDLKPGNIMLTKSGAKLLDFGLAKLRAEEKNVPEVSTLPTEQRDLTKEGMVLGTFQYMAPEQLEGREADARTDIFSFGAVMYEMATGKKAFEGKSQASLIAAILKEDPKPISEIQPLTPPILERRVKICLAKDPEDRWQSAHDISNQLRWISESSGSQTIISSSMAAPKSTRRPNPLGWIVAGALALALVAGSFWTWTRFNKKPTGVTSEVRFWIPPAPGASVAGPVTGNPDFAISPDGTKLVFSVTDPSSGKNQLWLRPLGSLAGQPIAGTEGAQLSIWSPNGQEIAFYADKKLKKVSLPGGSPQTICDIPDGMVGGAWLADDTIVLGLDKAGLGRVSASGGKVQPLTTLNRAREERAHSYPAFLPDGRHFLYICDSDKAEERAIYMGSLDSKDVVRILNARHKVNYVEPGYILFIRGISLMAQRLQVDPPRLVGEPIQVADEVSVNAVVNDAPFTASLNGTILYRSGDKLAKTQLAWFDRKGKLLGALGPVQSDISVRLSPDGTRAAIASSTGTAFRSATGEASVNIWVLDLARGVRTRVTLEPTISDENPTWSPDGRFLAFASHRAEDRAEIYEKASSGVGHDKLMLVGGTQNEHPIDWSKDGKYLLLHGIGNQTDLYSLSLSDAGSKPVPFVSTSADDAQGQFSPDNKWVAYTSSQSGRNEVYVQPFSSGDGKWQISSAGGSEPRWRGDGKELFYLTPDGVMMSVSVNSEAGFEATPPVVLFKTATIPTALGDWGGAAQYDVTKDGSRFLINTVVVPSIPPNLYVIVNWQPPQSK